LYNMRHVQEHAAQLSLVLGQRIGAALLAGSRRWPTETAKDKSWPGVPRRRCERLPPRLERPVKGGIRLRGGLSQA
jgi:hypothetical protein